MKEIEIKCSGKYLSENIDEFPFAEEGKINIINKGITGCGGTTLVKDTSLKNGYTTIILMPLKSSVLCKIDTDIRVSNVCGGRGKINLSANPFKSGNVVFATYDKFEAIKDEIGDASEIRLVIDEYHTITRDSSFRNVMKSIIKGWNEFYSVSLLTATPDKYFEDVIVDVYGEDRICKINYKWDTKPACWVKEIDGNIYTYLTEMIKNWLNDVDEERNLYFMYNNVKGITRIIEQAKLKEDDYYILCSASRENEVKVANINEVNKNLKRINFITAAGFEGVDINDDKGVIYTIFDINQNHTIFDWNTIVQMFGRCRGSKEAPYILYHKSKLRDDVLKDLKNKVKCLKLIKLELPEKTVKEVSKDDDYLILDGKIVVNPVLESEINRRKNIYENCQNLKDFVKYLYNNGILASGSREKVEKKKYKYNRGLGRGLGFKKLCLLYEKEGSLDSSYNRHHLVEKAYEKLGKEKIQKLNYSEKKVSLLLKTYDNYADKANIEAFLNIKVGNEYSKEVLRKKFEEANLVFGTSYDTKHVKDCLNDIGLLGKAISKRVKVDGNFKTVNWGFGIIQNLALSQKKGAKYPNRRIVLNELKNCDKVRISRGTKPGVKIYKPEFSMVLLNNDIVKPKTDRKEDGIVFSDCYNDTLKVYARNEGSFTKADCLMLDIDNGKKIEEFNEYVEKYLGGAFHYIYKSFSYTDDFNRYRVIFPLTETLNFTDRKDIQKFRCVKASLFPDFVDFNCKSWFYGPYENLMEFGDKNTYIDTDFIKSFMNVLEVDEETTEIVDIKPEIKEETKKTVNENNTNRIDTFLNMINTADWGEWNHNFWAVAYYCRWDEVEEIKAGIIGKERLNYFELKLKYKQKT